MPHNTNPEIDADSYHLAELVYQLLYNRGKKKQFFNVAKEWQKIVGDYNEGAFSLCHFSMTFLQELILKELVQNPEVYCFEALNMSSGRHWTIDGTSGLRPVSGVKLDFAKIKGKKILYLPCLDCTPGNHRNSHNSNLESYSDCLKSLLMGYKHKNLPLPEKIIFNCGSGKGVHVVTMVFDTETGKCQAIDDFGKYSWYDHIYDAATNTMNDALRAADWELHFNKPERLIKGSLHTLGAPSTPENPFGGVGTCYISSLLIAAIAAKYDDVKQGMCDFVGARLNRKYTKAQLDENVGHAFGKASWSWFISVMYNLARKYPQELYRVGSSNYSPDAHRKILEEIGKYARQHDLEVFPENHPCMQVLRKEHIKDKKSTAQVLADGPNGTAGTTSQDGPAKPSPSAAAGNETTGGTGKAKSYSLTRPMSIGWESESKNAPFECSNRHHWHTEMLISSFKNAAPGSKAKSFFDANVSFIRKIPIIRAICNWILFGRPFGKFFWKHSFEAKLAHKLDTLVHQKCHQMMSKLEAVIFDEKDAGKLKKYKEIILNRASKVMLSKEDKETRNEILIRREVAVLITECLEKSVALNDEDLTIDDLLEKVAQTPEEDKNLSLDKFLERLGLHLDQTIERACRKQLEKEKQKNQGTELSSDTPSTKFTKEGESSKISPESTTSSVQAR